VLGNDPAAIPNRSKVPGKDGEIDCAYVSLAPVTLSGLVSGINLSPRPGLSISQREFHN
jgi:hypothetical protein